MARVLLEKSITFYLEFRPAPQEEIILGIENLVKREVTQSLDGGLYYVAVLCRLLNRHPYTHRLVLFSFLVTTVSVFSGQ